MSINTRILTPFEDHHAGEFCAVVRDNRPWHAAFGNDQRWLGPFVARQWFACRWPGLSEAGLYERRDFVPATDVRSMVA